jgi:acyl-CoA reductase-like NAD-dependent aldehyde dehydrogenase
MQVRDKFYIGGDWRSPSTTETIDVHNVGTGQVMGRVPAGGEDDIAAAVAAARVLSPAGRIRRPPSAPTVCRESPMV